MTRDQYREVFLEFPTPTAVSARRGTVQIRALETEAEAFAGDRTDPTWDVNLPQPFMDTALMDPEGAAWHAKPLRTDSALKLGERMWSSLPAELQQRITSRADTQRPMLLKIGSSCSGLDDVPWEWMGGEHGAPLALDPGIRMVRTVPVLHPNPPLTVRLPLRVLIVLTNPKDERLLDAGTEIAVVQSGLSDAALYEVRTAYEPGLAALQRALEWEPAILHYIGHAGISGTGGNLILHDADGTTAWLSAIELARILPASVRLVCLSTCVTARNYQVGGLRKVAHATAEVALPSALVNQYAIEADSATAFWRVFYPELIAAEGNAIEALHRARVAVASKQGAFIDWASFSLVLRDGHLPAFRIGAAADSDPNRLAEELQAQFAARLANSLADRLRHVAPAKELADQLKSSIEVASKTFDDLTRKLF